MTVIVKFENGRPLYRSIDGPGASEEDRKKAKKLDSLIKNEMKQLNNRLSDKINKRNIVLSYWEFGSVLRKIFYNSGLVKKEEQVYFEENVRLHASADFIAKDRNSGRRHIDYCMRLASYEKKIAMKMKWGEWNELFDRSKEKCFDEWFNKKTAKRTRVLERKFIRKFTKVKNAFFYNIETKDFEKDELYRCFEASWQIASKLNEIENEEDRVDFKKRQDEILEKIKKEKEEKGELILGAINSKTYEKHIFDIQ